MRFCNLNYFNVYSFLVKSLLIAILCLLTINCGQKETKQLFAQDRRFSDSKNTININTASAEELEKLPKIGPKTAEKIVAYRKKYGKFRKAEHLILVSGISDKRFREIQNLITAE